MVSDVRWHLKAWSHEPHLCRSGGEINGVRTIRPPSLMWPGDGSFPAAVGVPDAMRSGQASVRRRRTARRQRQVGLGL